MYNSLKESIKYLENLQDSDLENEELVNLYKVDFSKIEADAKKNYAINIVSGMLYSIEYEEYQGKYYHTPKIGFKLDENGGVLEEIGKELNIKEPGKYNVIINANEIVKWDSIEVVYDKFVDGTATLTSTTTNNLYNWAEVDLAEAELTGNIEKYAIESAENSQYIKLSINLEENVSGENSEIYYVKVNYYKLEKTDIEPIIDTEADFVDGIYTAKSPAGGNGSTEASGTATVTQTVTLPTDGNYVLDLKEYGNPSTTVTITKPDGTVETITGEELKNTEIPSGSAVKIETTLNAGDGVSKVEVLKKDDKLSSTTTATVPEETEEWVTVDQKQFMYSNGGQGVWEACFVTHSETETLVGSTGIIGIDANKQIQVEYQISEDGSEWSEPFADLTEAEDKKYLKILVNYQTKNDVEFGDTSGDKVTVMINDGYWTATFKDADGNLLAREKAYFINADEQAKITTLATAPAKEGKQFLDWLVGETPVATNTEYTMTTDTEFIAEYMIMDIYTVTDLTQFRDLVNRGFTYSGLTVNLMNDLDLSSVCSSTKGNWTPIGYWNSDEDFLGFSGVFNGNGHKIDNLYINSTRLEFAALFAIIDNATISNLNVDGYVKNHNNAGGITAGVAANGRIINCKNYADVSSVRCSGGIVGNCNGVTYITNCANYGAIYGSSFSIGGIGGSVHGATVQGCYNAGKVSANINVGGIVGDRWLLGRY